MHTHPNFGDSTSCFDSVRCLYFRGVLIEPHVTSLSGHGMGNCGYLKDGIAVDISSIIRTQMDG